MRTTTASVYCITSERTTKLQQSLYVQQLSLYPVLDEGMQKTLVEGDPLGGVEDVDLVQEVPELADLAQLILGQLAPARQLGVQVPRLVDRGHGHDLLPLRDLVNVAVQEAAVGVKMKILALSFPAFEGFCYVKLLKLKKTCYISPDDLVGNLALKVHEEFEHVVISLAREHDLARVQLVEGCTRAPQVDTEIVLHPQDHLWRSIKSGQKIFRLILRIFGQLLKIFGQLLKIFGQLYYQKY